ncbi:MAG TPA: metal ABC transporter permease [Spirochaetes bacterium]|nr:metal ABC transporter permease [Spirochaetota bacterium]
MLTLLSMDFFRYALLMALMLSLLFGLLSFFVVMRKMSFLGAGISHAAFGGVALGIFLEINPFFSSLVFCIASAFIIGRLVKSGRLSYDAGIGIFFAFSMALGALLISLKKEYGFDLSGYLFGNILGVTGFDVLMTSLAMSLFLPVVLLFMRRIIFMTFDEEVAAVSGVRTGILDSLLLVFLAAVIVISIKVVGIILVSALVVLPASFGLLISSDYRRVIAWSVLYTLGIMFSGLFLSYFLDLPAGAAIVTLGTLVYGLTLAVQRLYSG